MENIKLICLDMDGTTIKYINSISKRNTNAIIKAQEKGYKVAIISGRPKSGIIKHAKKLRLKEFGGSIAALNGGIIESLDDSQVLFSKKMELDHSIEYLNFINRPKIYPLVYFDEVILAQKSFLSPYVNTVLRSINNIRTNLVDNLNDSIYQEPRKISLVGDKSEIMKIKDQIKEKFSDKFQLIFSSNLIEANPLGIDKGHALEVLADFYNISLDDILAFGDELNDIEMIKKAGYGVVVQNGRKELKKYADYISLSNRKDGVGRFLEKYIL